MFGRFFRGGRGQGRRLRRHGGPEAESGSHPLSDFAQGADVTVVANRDRKTLEMGLFTGAAVHVLQNRPADANMVIAAGESRYIISKESAAKIKVR